MTPDFQHYTDSQFQADNATHSKKLSKLHDRILESYKNIDRIAVTLYEESADTLKTFINSTRKGETITRYEYKLSDSASLSRIANEGVYRVIDDIPKIVGNNNQHSAWLLEQGYLSSFTVPLYDNGKFLGILFFDSQQKDAFSSNVQRDLLLYANLINMIISDEKSALRSIIASTNIVREVTCLRDFETGAHLERMARFARLIALELSTTLNLSDEFIEHIYQFAPLHDVGKIGIPDKILLKTGKHDANERAIMQSHVSLGCELVKKILGDFALQSLPDSMILQNIVGLHHEFLDGSGYPNGYKGDQIPIEARIITVADIFDALTSMRPYKRNWHMDEAIIELERMVAAGKLDTMCVAALKVRLPDITLITREFPDI